MQTDWIERGRRVRWEIIGADVMDPIYDSLDDVTQDQQDLVSGFAWGEVFTRPGLSRRTRLLVNIASLAVLGERETLRHHVRAASHLGCTREEIRETLIQCGTIGGGVRATLACRVAQDVLDGIGAEGS